MSPWCFDVWWHHTTELNAACDNLLQHSAPDCFDPLRKISCKSYQTYSRHSLTYISKLVYFAITIATHFPNFEFTFLTLLPHFFRTHTNTRTCQTVTIYTGLKYGDKLSNFDWLKFPSSVIPQYFMVFISIFMVPHTTKVYTRHVDPY